jgi:hypothetical protein
MKKFEQLIEYVINDEDAKARELFHEIVVEKSREIYENLMDEEVNESEEDLDESEEDLEEGVDEAMGGDQADDLIDDIEVEEEGISMEAEGDDEEEDHHADVGGEEELEDRVVDLEDKLDELMAEFEALMGDEGGEQEMDMEVDADGVDMDMDMDAAGGDMSDEEVVDDEFETEGMAPGMMEAVSLKAVPKPTHGDDGANKKSPVAANAGARGALAKPVHATGTEAQGRPAPTAKDAIGRVGNTPAQGTQKPTPATKPHLAQATGVNTKSPLPKQ